MSVIVLLYEFVATANLFLPSLIISTKTPCRLKSRRAKTIN